GDLAPLAAMAITLIGEGYVLGDDGARIQAKDLALPPLALSYKEALSLINGTSAMSGLACLVLADFRSQIAQAEIIAALALEALAASTGAFAAAGHERAKPHPGQVASAANMRRLTAGSGLAASHESLAGAMRSQAAGGKAGTGVFMQKAYSLRCIPQVIGAVRDTAQYPATALVAENRTLCGAASIQSVPANGDNQDVVSMGLIGARTAKRIVSNTSYILAIELLAACQALDLAGRTGDLSPAGRAVHAFVRSSIPALDEDRYMTDEIELA